MAKYTQEQTDEFKEKIRQIMVRMPRVTCHKLAEQLKIDKDFANRLRNEILKDSAENINKQTINEEVGKMENEFEEMALELWRILGKGKTEVVDDKKVITEPYPTNNEIIHAIRALTEAKKKLFEIKFDAGVFSRKLGELEIETKTTIDKLLENATPELKQQFNEILKKILPDKRKREPEALI